MFFVTGPGDQQHVGVARRGDEAQAEALQIVEGIGERVDLQLAAVAGAGVDLADRRGCGPELGARGAVDLRRQRGELGDRRPRAARSVSGPCQAFEQSLRIGKASFRDRAPNRSS